MESKILTTTAAWSDFWAWIKTQPTWEGLSRYEKQYLDKTNRQMKIGCVGGKRISRIFDKHAPGRYVFVSGFVIQEW